MVCSGMKWDKCLSFYINHTYMFIGEFSHTLDEKGRVSVPKKFRTALEDGVVLTRGLDNCLFVYTKTEWEKLAEKLASLPFAQANTRAFARLMLAGAMDAEVDKQGRVVVPEYLRTFAKLGKDVVIAGLYNRLEIWDQETWSAYKEKTEAESGEIAERMAELGV